MLLVTQRKPRTKDSTPRLSDLARHVVLPVGIVSTGWPAVRDTCRSLGIGFDPWQDSTGKAILAKRADGQYAAGVGGVVLSIPRQVGKTYMIGWIVFALCIIFPGLTVIWTAHRSRTADETFESMRSMTNRREMVGHIERVTVGGGDQTIWFTNGSRILFGARESGFGRGFTEVDVLVFDEAQILTERAIDDMIPAQNASQNALTLFMGTPPKPTDPSEVFETARREALEGISDDALYVEFSADPDADPDDRAQLRKANPSYPHRTREAAMLRMRRRLSPDSFRREAMGIWDELATKLTAFPSGAWGKARNEDPDPDWPIAAIGLDMNPERTKVAIGLVARGEESMHVEVALDADYDETGAPAIVDWVFQRAKRRLPVVIDSFSPARSLEPLLKAKGCKVWVLSSAEFAQACMGLHDAVRDGGVTHFGQESLDLAVGGACKEPMGKAGAWKFSRSGLDVELRHLMSVTCAHFGAVKSKPRKSAGDRKAVIL